MRVTALKKACVLCVVQGVEKAIGWCNLTAVPDTVPVMDVVNVTHKQELVPYVSGSSLTVVKRLRDLRWQQKQE